MKNCIDKVRKLSSFTLIELTFVVMIISLIMPSMFALYNFIIRSNREIGARQGTIQQAYEFFERLNVMMQDYTIDYEEYYNRQMVGCVEGGGTGRDFDWNVGVDGYCTKFTAYGNENIVGKVDSKFHNVYYCSSIPESSIRSHCSGSKVSIPRVVQSRDCGKLGGRQSFGQYAALFVDVGDDEENLNSANQMGRNNCVGDADDINKGSTVGGPFVINAIEDANHIQELYFISHDGKSRLYFRRKLVNTGDGAQYKIQMLRLRGFDAGSKHSFGDVSSGNVGLYDGVIDTWACDYGMGFIGSGGGNVGGAYTGYKLPVDADDCWIDLTHGSTTVSAWNIIISPTTDSDLAWAEQNRQINAFMKILTVNGVYVPFYNGKVSDSIKDFKMPLETTINMKDFYRN